MTISCRCKATLAKTCSSFYESLGIQFGLINHSIPKDNLEYLSQQAIEDPCHSTNTLPVTKEALLEMYQQAFKSTESASKI